MSKITTLYCCILIWFCLCGVSNAFDRASLHEKQVGIPSERLAPLQYSLPLNLATAADDILLSESLAPATFEQQDAVVASLGSNIHLIAFSDNRQGSFKIFAQELDADGGILSSNYTLASSSSGADYVDPRLMNDSLGRVYFFYRDKTNGYIFGQRFDSLLQPLGTEYLINDTSGGSFAGLYAAAVYPDGRMVITWEQYTTSGNTIEFRIYDNNGNSVLISQTANTDGSGNTHWVPSVAVDPSGDFLISWEDYRNGNADIYARLFNGAGVPVGSDFTIVPAPFSSANQYAPQVAFNPAAGFVIGWLDQRVTQEVYLQRYSAASGLIGGNMLASDGDLSTIQWDLTLAMATNNTLGAAWASFGPENNLIHQHFDSTLNPIQPAHIVSLGSSGQRWDPSLFYVPDKHLIVWTEITNTNADIFFDLFNSLHSSLVGSPRMINDDARGAISSEPAITSGDSWYKLIAYTDQRFDDGDIFVQAVSNAGNILNGSQKINTDIGNILQQEPAISADESSGTSLVVWVDSRDINAVPGQRIFGRLGSSLGLYSDTEFLISDSLATDVKQDPAVMMLPSGRSLVLWKDTRLGIVQVFGSMVETDGTAGADFLISNTDSDSNIVSLRVGGINSANQFYVSWLNQSGMSSEIKGRVLSSTGSIIDSFSYVASVPGTMVRDYALDVRVDGSMAVVFVDAATPRDLWLTQIDTTGSELLSPVLVTDNPTPLATEPSLMVDNNDYISVCWTDMRAGKKQVYYQLFDNITQPVGGNQLVSSAAVEYMHSPITYAAFGRAFFVWVDPRNNGDNIYANILVYLPTDVEEPGEPNLPVSFALEQNYPNPFNPSTTIAFSLPEASEISVEIFNITGQRVKVLAEAFYAAGTFELSWDGTNQQGHTVSSGVYLYRLQTDSFTALRKMVLMK